MGVRGHRRELPRHPRDPSDAGPKSGLWTGGILLDDDARKWFVLGSPAARDRANNLSDYFTFGPQVFVFADGAASLLYGADLDTAWQIEMMNLEVLGVMGTFTRLGEQYVRRTRPATIACESDPRYESACKAGPYASFPSGHSALAFTAAGLVCAHHTNIPLYGGGLPDYLTCAAGLASAVTSGSLRLMADRHWFSDVIIGTALGLGGGWGLPVLLHYRGGAKHDPAAAYWGIAPTPMPSGAGATMFGLF